MEFIITEKNGEKPIDEWMISGIKEHAKKKYGIILDISIKKQNDEHHHQHDQATSG